MTVYAKLLAQETDPLNYTTYVFKLLDEEDKNALETRYIMCTRFPNWDHRELLNGEIGYVSFDIIQAGVDKWYKDGQFTPYNYSHVQFQKMLLKQSDTVNKELTM